jgi:hypothetical protein
MDAGLAIKPVAGTVAPEIGRPAVASVDPGVPTDLPQSKAVNPAAPSIPPDNSAGEYTTHDVTIDPQLREVIYRVIDTRTRQVLQQVPDQALLRTRAYSKAIENGSSPFAAQAQADLEV